MNIGRELDALVAEKVMGWTREGAGWHTKPWHRPSKDYPGSIINDWDSKGEHDFLVIPNAHSGISNRVSFCGCEGDAEIPHYSTSIAAAWEIVEKLNSTEFVLERWPELQFTVRSTFIRGENFSVANSAPHSICLAALKAMGVTFTDSGIPIIKNTRIGGQW